MIKQRLHPQFFSLLLLLVFITSCKGQNRTPQNLVQPKDSISEPKSSPAWLLPTVQPKTNALDNDPYFTGTTTINSPYGPHNITRNIMQDRNGNFWLASWEGIIRYDGKTFTNITTNFTGYVYEDNKGNIWISAFDGSKRDMALSRYYKKYLPYEQSNLTLIKKQEGQVFGIIEDKNDNIWFGTEGGVCRYDGKAFTTFTN